MRHAVVVGSCVRDIKLRVNALPEWGDQAVVSLLGVQYGGKGANQACCLSRLGLSTTFVASIGADALGREFRDYLESQGVVCAFSTDPCEPTAMALVLVRPDGERIFLVAPGAAVHLRDEHVCGHGGLFAEAEVVLMQCEIDPTAFDATRASARAAHAPLVVNAAPWSDWIAPRLADLGWVIVNRHEALCAFGVDALEGRCAVEAINRIRQERRVEHLLVTVGSRGVFALNDESCTWMPPIRVNVLDTTGAGDAFSAGVAVGVARGWDLERVVSYASRCGAFACQRIGGCESMPSKMEIEEQVTSPGSLRKLEEVPWDK